MVSDDLTALTAISMGTLASVAVSLTLTAGGPVTPPAVDPVTPSAVDAERPRASCTGPERVIDFAIIRSDAQTMAGRERPVTGRSPETLELRLLRSR